MSLCGRLVSLGGLVPVDPSMLVRSKIRISGRFLPRCCVSALNNEPLCQQSCAQTALKDCDEIFADLISSMLKRQREVKQLIADQEKTAITQAEGLQLQLEDEIRKLRRRDAELELLLRAGDHIHLIQVPDTFSVLLDFLKKSDS